MTDVIANLNSRAWQLVEHDPVTGRREYEAEISPGVIVVRTEYYMDRELLDANTAIANHNDGKRWGSGQIAASVPLNVFYRDLMQPMREGDKRWVKRWMNDGDHAGFRTFRGVV